MRVDMPMYACHHDPKYFPNPEKFLPERFLKSNVENIPQYAFRPFGGKKEFCLRKLIFKIAIFKEVPGCA